MWRRVWGRTKELKWADDLASEAERAAGNERMKELYQPGYKKTLCNNRAKTNNAVKDKNGKLLTEEAARKKRRCEHFEEVLNRPVPNNPVTDEILETDANEIVDIRTDYISKAEIRAAIRKVEEWQIRWKGWNNCWTVKNEHIHNCGLAC